MLFWIAEDHIHDLATNPTIRYPLRMTMDDRSGVHDLAGDYELDVAWLGATGLASRSAVVAEPPSLCSDLKRGTDCAVREGATKDREPWPE